jgi:hypothetical protein
VGDRVASLRGVAAVFRSFFFGFPFPSLPRKLRLADPSDSQGGAAMKRITIPRRLGHELDAGADDCLAYVIWAGIPAHLGRAEPGATYFGSKTSLFIVIEMCLSE